MEVSEYQPGSGEHAKAVHERLEKLLGPDAKSTPAD